MSNVLMKAKNLKKTFNGFVANDGINLTIESGKIYALAGENGAGKSTLMKMLYGVYKMDGGELYIDGKKMEKYNPSIARARGIGMVFQDFRLIPAFTALENTFITLEDMGMYFNRTVLRQRMKEISKQYNLGVNPDESVWRLDLGRRQHIEILKVLLNKNSRILIFDEPTSVLAPNEIQSFLDLLIALKNDGFAVILITHKIREIVQVADVVHILRKGKMVHTFYREEGLRESDIVSQMVGSNDDKLKNTQTEYTGEGKVIRNYEKMVLCCSNMTIRDDYGRIVIKNSKLEIAPGMILGVAGISGNGQREITEVLYGIRKIDGGRILYDGKDITNASIEERIKYGFRILSEDPIRDNLVPDFTILQHMAITGLTYQKKHGNIDWEELKKQMDHCQEMDELNVPAAERRADKLSGGNIQRMVFARAVLGDPKLLIVSYPSRGLDIATVNAVHETLEKLREKGTAILFISEDLNELFKMSDSLVVLSENTINGPYPPEKFDADQIGTIMLKGVGE